MVPREKSEAVTRALRETFGVGACEEIRPMTGGLTSALKFRIVVRGSPYLLKIITRISEMTNPARQFAHMKAAADAGLAPRVWYAGAEDGICITDFVNAVPFPLSEALGQIPRTLRVLHSLPPFPEAMNFVTMHNAFIWRFRAAGILPESETEEVFGQYARVAAVYPRCDSDLVSCHNDLKPENVLFDGQRVWLVDWEASLLNDRYYDLAIVANFLVADEQDESALLAEYLGQSPDEYQLARLFLMRQAMHLFYAAIFLIIGSSGKRLGRSEEAVEFRDFHRRIWAGEVGLGDNDLKVAYGRVHWQQLLCNVRQKRFDDALRIVSGRHAHAEGTPRLLPVASSIST